MQLANGRVYATLAVSDLGPAKEFYGGTLGLNQVSESAAGVMYESGGGSRVFVYPSGSVGTNQATYAGWDVDDVDSVVAELKDKGVEFEHYDLEGATWEGDVAVWGSTRSAWFKDPDGNILSVTSM